MNVDKLRDRGSLLPPASSLPREPGGNCMLGGSNVGIHGADEGAGGGTHVNVGHENAAVCRVVINSLRCFGLEIVMALELVTPRPAGFLLSSIWLVPEERKSLSDS